LGRRVFVMLQGVLPRIITEVHELEAPPTDSVINELHKTSHTSGARLSDLDTRETFSSTAIDPQRRQEKTTTINRLPPHAEERYFSRNRFTLRVVNEIAILMTFGAVFPPLALIIFTAMCSYTLFTQLTIGRFIVLNSSRGGVEFCRLMRDVETDCKGVSQQIVQTFGLLVFFSSVFYSFFLLDTLGDSVGWRRALWLVVLTCTLPIVTLKCIEAMCHTMFERDKAAVSNKTQQQQPVEDQPSVELSIVSRNEVI
jgi:hypothetical protein